MSAIHIRFSTFLFFLFSSFQIALAQQSDKILWYQQPARFFEETLVLGNGTQGACVFGGVKQDKIFLNDITLWSGEPVADKDYPNAYPYLAPVREALVRKLAHLPQSSTWRKCLHQQGDAGISATSA